MDKLTMAHEFAMQLIKAGATNKTTDIIKFGWEYADAMQAEADSRVNKERPDVLQEEWQPDWSQAPDDAMYWAMDENGLCNWYKNKPEVHIDQWDFGNVVESSKSFNYQGNWQDSLRKRP